MAVIDSSTIRIMRKIHRWGGLVLAAFILFYCITGVLLNHRKAFRYFTNKEKTEYRVPASDTARMRKFIDFYKGQINRTDDPTVIRIKKGGTIEFLYGSHGKTTYIIDPAQGRMERVEKQPVEPWSWLNRLHKAFKTGWTWVVISDLISICLIVVTITGMIIFKYRVADFISVALGVLIFILATAVAG